MEQRQPAEHIWISELLSGSFIQQEDAPGALEINSKTIYRARLNGTVVSTDELVVDDGTGSILVRTFDKSFNVKLGDPVLVIGIPRVYESQPYLLGEIVKKIDAKWLEVRAKQHSRRTDQSSDAVSIVRSLDKGNGADYDEVTAKLGKKGEELIVHLLATGELFETRPGKIKVLE